MKRTHLVASGLGLALVFAASVSAAQATIQLTVPGQPANNEINDTDPAAVSGTLLLGPSNLILVSGFASGAADLTAGTVRVRSTGLTKIEPGGYPTANASIVDTITFHGPGPTVQVKFDMTADGLFSSAGSGKGFLRQVAQVFLVAGNFNTKALFERDYTTSDTDPPVETLTLTILTPAPDAGFVTTHPTVMTGPMSTTLHIDAAFAVEAPIGVSASAAAQAGVSGQPKDISIDDDFGNTARVTMTLPPGYTFTSKSGVFLTNQGAPGLGLPPDGSPGVHGAPGAPPGSSSGASGSSGATPNDGGAGGGGGSSSDSGCSAAGSASSASASLLVFAVLTMLRLRRRHREDPR